MFDVILAYVIVTTVIMIISISTIGVFMSILYLVLSVIEAIRKCK